MLHHEMGKGKNYNKYVTNICTHVLFGKLRFV